jgi:hypothetical protein
MKKEHEENEVARMMGEDRGHSLGELVDAGIQKPVKGAGYGILLPKEKDGDEVIIKYTF